MDRIISQNVLTQLVGPELMIMVNITHGHLRMYSAFHIHHSTYLVQLHWLNQ